MYDWLKIKIIRDFKKLSKYQNSSTLSETNELLKFELSFSKNYLSLIKLIRNAWYSQHSFFNRTLPNRSIRLSDLNDLNIDLFKKIVNLKNVAIVESPIFHSYYIDESNLVRAKNVSVSTSHHTSTLEYLKNNQNHFFYIYEIDDTLSRWYEDDDIDYLKYIRKEKLKKLEIEL